jgi:hypothetical protein
MESTTSAFPPRGVSGRIETINGQLEMVIPKVSAGGGLWRRIETSL